MDNLRSIVKLLFRYTSTAEIMKGTAGYDRVRDDNLLMLANQYMPGYSNDEIKNMFYYLSNEFEWQNNRLRGEEQGHRTDKINVFDALLVLSDALLIEENGYPVCQYEHLLRWRETTLLLDEDTLITSFLGYRDLYRQNIKRSFFWKPVIGHNNRSLNKLMEKGVAENHFHLKGSAPLFHLSWINMMNHVSNPNFLHVLDSYDKRRLNPPVMYGISFLQIPLKVMYIQAVIIRLFLFSKISGLTFGLLKSKTPHLAEPALDPEAEELDRVYYWLEHPAELEYHLNDVQRYINALQEELSAEIDYAICKEWLWKNPESGLNEILPGERWFMYECFRHLYIRGDFLIQCGNLFYMYIVTKTTIRAELIQSNTNVGFDNFLLYQNRKEAFIENTPLEKLYVKMAVRDTIENQHIISLEARIAPKASAYENKCYIKKLDSWITAGMPEDKRQAFSEKYFYVFHFIKEPEQNQEISMGLLQECRHNQKRKSVRQQAQAIALFRTEYLDEAARVLGIDASSPEIDCRAEVFAQAFRYLREHTVHMYSSILNQYVQLPDLRLTYHVGEDFLDIIDGMRAIDEAVCFLNLRCGDRLGHALAIGVDVQEWYASKSTRILISQMDYLDNLVWLYSKIRKFQLTDFEDAVKYIEKRYDEYFRIIYLNNMSTEYFNTIVEEAKEYFSSREIPNHYLNKLYHFSINTYYDSWKLRGDNPEFYKRGYFRIGHVPLEDWDTYGVNKIFPDNYRIRYNPEAAFLYHLYHYNSAVRKEGTKKIEIKVNPCIIRAAIAVQKRMQHLIAKKGISIETNPSSNYQIGSFKRYDRHPMLQWYNYGLTNDPEQLEISPQIPISINTDDQGVFATYIENEYALMALALEKARDSDGNRKYNRTMIYHWLNQLRELSIDQSFSSIKVGGRIYYD